MRDPEAHLSLNRGEAPAWMRDFRAMLSLSQTQRRLAHRCKSEALKWLKDGNTYNYNNLRQESDRLWRDAKYHFAWARRLAR